MQIWSHIKIIEFLWNCMQQFVTSNTECRFIGATTYTANEYVWWRFYRSCSTTVESVPIERSKSNLPFLLELMCPYSLLRSIAITVLGKVAHTTKTKTAPRAAPRIGCGDEATRIIADACRLAAAHRSSRTPPFRAL